MYIDTQRQSIYHDGQLNIAATFTYKTVKPFTQYTRRLENLEPSLTHYLKKITFGNSFPVSGQLVTMTIPQRTSIGSDEWFYSVIMVLVGSCPGGNSPIWIVVPVGNGWVYLYPVGNCPWWGVVLEPSFPMSFIVLLLEPIVC